MVLHSTIKLFDKHTLMFTDAPEEMGHKLTTGNAISLSLHVDSKAEADSLFGKLSENGEIQMPMQDTFWGAYHGQCTDQFGIKWMVNYE